MDSADRLRTLLDDPAVRAVVYGLAHVGAFAASGEAGAPRLRAVVCHLAETTEPQQYRRWTEGETGPGSMTADQARRALGDDAVNDLALYAETEPTDIASQLATVLPGLVSAVSPGGAVLDANELGQQLRAAVAEDDQSAGSFGPQTY